MKVKRNSGFASNDKRNNKPVKLVLDIPTLDILCRYTLSSSSIVRTTHLVNLKKLITVLDRSTYETDPEKQKRVEFITKALEAKLDFHLTDKNMVLTHVNGSMTGDIDFIDYATMELNKHELDWANQLISETIQYQFVYNRIDQIQDVCTRFTASDYSHRGGVVKELENLVDLLKADFRQSRVNNNSIDMTFSLRDEAFETSVRETYELVTNPNRKLVCGMTGLNDLVGGGFESGRVYMFFGLSGVGKSLTLLNLLTQMKKYNRYYIAKDPTKTPCIVLLTMENTVVETITRLFSLSDPNNGDMAEYSIDEVLHILRETGELKITADSPIDIVIRYKANKSVDTSYLYTLCEDLEDENYEVICMVQDHVKRIRSVYNAQDIRIELGDVVNEMKSFAAEKDIPVITVSHLNRDAARVMEDGAAKGATADLTMKMGKSNVGESLLMIDNLDFGIIINQEFDGEGNRYLVYNLIKHRSKPRRYYIAQPFMYGSTIRLVEDLYDTPAFKETLRQPQQMTQRSSSIKMNSTISQNTLDKLMTIDDITDNAFSNASHSAVDLNKTIIEEPEEERVIVKPIYFLDELANMGSDIAQSNLLADLQAKINNSRV